ncbi:MAG: hypothetical protein JO186_10435 [Actinobacteria bacterium]|nr:hypothetical protein [Actinomycetota bacterium]MBV8396218.1 hypothetical protein [Actinomycetota bacterium]MBV8599100.1 hypothetical protein [Actinomycetota bacterium]
MRATPVFAAAALAALWPACAARAVPVTVDADAGVRIAAGQVVTATYTLGVPGRGTARVSFDAAAVVLTGRCGDGTTASVEVPLAAGPYALVASRAVTSAARAPRTLCAGGVLHAERASFSGDIRSTAALRVSFRVGSLGATPAVDVPADASRVAGPLVPDTPAPPTSTTGLRIATQQHVVRSAHRIDYRITVTNTSAEALAVALADPRCDKQSVSPFPVQTVLAGASLSWECSHLAQAGDGPAYANTAAALGTAQDGTEFGPVAATSTVRV